MTRIEQIELCHDLVATVGIAAAAAALAEASEGGLTVAGARSLLEQTLGEPRREYEQLRETVREELRRLRGY